MKFKNIQTGAKEYSKYQQSLVHQASIVLTDEVVMMASRGEYSSLRPSLRLLRTGRDREGAYKRSMIGRLHT